jgi:hypothetical protein
MRLRARLYRLERNQPLPVLDPDQCRLWYVGALVVDNAPGEEVPSCRTYGGRHVIREILTIVRSAEAEGPS